MQVMDFTVSRLKKEWASFCRRFVVVFVVVVGTRSMDLDPDRDRDG